MINYIKKGHLKPQFSSHIERLLLYVTEACGTTSFQKKIDQKFVQI